jgi:hypothetical protein
MRESILRLIAFPAALFLLLIMLLFQNQAKGQERPGIQPFPASEMDAFLDHLDRHNKFMGSVAVLSDGEIVYSRAVGLADTDGQIPNTVRTRHHIGSVTKTFTATLILQLAEEGKLRLDQPLSDFFDGFQSNLAIYPEDDLHVALAANALSWPNNNLLVALLDAWHGKPLELPDFDTVTLTAEHLQTLAGTYASAQIPLEIRIWEDDGLLMAQATGQGAIPMEPGSKTRFRFDPAGLAIEFRADETGNYRSFTLFQAGMEFHFERK